MRIYYKAWAGDMYLGLQVTNYLDGSIAIIATAEYDGYEELYDDVTKFITHLGYQNLAAVNTNGLPGIDEELIKAGLGIKVGEVQSGYCTYPVIAFDLEKLKAFDEDGVLKLESLPYDGEKIYGGQE